ncbi:hypothetical protein [Streptomyces sp. NPDC057682]|uniref:hypothetical protein n=1 Tax=unclassified Streptomyces TaxID=2593676 RepID=UPI00365E1C0C
MRRPARLVTGTAAAALTAAALGLGAAAPSAYGEPAASLEITPASAAPGAVVTVNTTACGGDTAATGDAKSLDAPEFRLAPATLQEVLAGTFTVPGNAEPGPYRIGVDCANGKRATGEIEVRAAGAASKDTGQSAGDRPGGNTAGQDTSDRAPESDAPADDASGSGLPSDDTGSGLPSDAYGTEPYGSAGLDEAEAEGSALVPDAPDAAGLSSSGDWASPSQRPSAPGRASSSPGRDDTSSGHETPAGRHPSAEPTAPTGHVKTGVGGSVGPDTTQIAAGAGVLAATAVGGAWLLRRRASGTRDG